MFISSKDYFQEFSETSIVMTYPARAWYVASDEDFSLLGPFPCVAVGRHFLPETISSELGLERTFSYPRWELIYAMQPALTLPQSLFPVQKMSFTANLQIIRFFSHGLYVIFEFQPLYPSGLPWIQLQLLVQLNSLFKQWWSGRCLAGGPICYFSGYPWLPRATGQKALG